MDRPNILYVVLDAFRADAVKRTDTIDALADQNVRFTEAITPATWSLPAHASLLTGEYPHAHGVTRSGDELDGLPLVETLNDRGYATYGVSGNPFFSRSQGFAGPFDEFWYTTLMRYPEGLDVSNYEGTLAEGIGRLKQGDLTGIRHLGQFGGAVLGHRHSLKSLGNVAYAAGTKLELAEQGLDIRHPFADNTHAYSPETNTEIITRIFEEEADSGGPFFVFTNYMDTHDPYDPPAEFRSGDLEHLDTWRDVRAANEALNAWEPVSSETDEERLETIRKLYEGEVRSVDSHVRELMDALERLGLREDTVVILTSDHGENLGEVDRRGRRRMGHVSSLSDALVTVPLVVASPGAESRTVPDPVSTKDLATAIMEDTLVGEAGVDPSSVAPADGVVLCESPARGGTDALTENHPETARELIEEETRENNVLGRVEDWRAIRTSAGGRWAWEGDDEVDYAACPERLRETIDDALRALDELQTGEGLSESAIDRLRDLGYV